MFFNKSKSPSPEQEQADSNIDTKSIKSATSSEIPTTDPSSSKAGVFSRWTQRISPNPSTPTTPRIPKVAPLNNDMVDLNMKISALQDQHDDLQQVLGLNRATLQKVVADLEGKEKECLTLRESIRVLEGKLEENIDQINVASALKLEIEKQQRTLDILQAERNDASIHSSEYSESELRQKYDQAKQDLDHEHATNADLTKEMKTLQDKCEFLDDCKKTYKRSNLAKDGQIAELTEKLKAASSTIDDDERERYHMTRVKLFEKDKFIFELQKALRTKIRDLSAKLKSLQHDYDHLIQERDHLLQDIDVYKDAASLLKPLQTENEILAHRAASAEIIARKFNSHIGELRSQRDDFATQYAEEQQAHKKQVDSLFAQHQREREHYQGKLNAQEALIKELQDKLKQSEVNASKAIHARDGDIDGLQDQLRRLQIDRDEAVQQAESWQEYANKGH